jgi:hypothetical protein
LWPANGQPGHRRAGADELNLTQQIVSGITLSEGPPTVVQP